MKIFHFPKESLREQCDPVYPGDISAETMSSLVEAMYSGSGVGLAAPQVGINKTLFVMDQTAGERSGFLEIVINPEILEVSDEMQVFIEGCLSLPGVFEDVERHRKISVQYINASGKQVSRVLEGFSATVFQHEFDHLRGKLFIDRISSLKRNLALKGYYKREGIKK